MRNSLELLILLILSYFLFACSEANQLKSEESLIEANYYLSSLNCGQAQSSLDSYAGSVMNPSYIETLAAIEACYSGFSVINFFADDITQISASNLFNSLTTFSTSDEAMVDSDEYLALKNAIAIITRSDTDSAWLSSDRNLLFGQKRGEDLSLFAAYMQVAFLGKWLQLYGNTDSDGVKGAGSFTNQCVFPYTFPAAQFIIDNTSTGSCQSPYRGPAALDVTLEDDEVVAKRICDYVVTLNHLFDILTSVTLSSNSSLGGFVDIEATLDALFDAAEQAYPGASIYRELYQESSCVDLVVNNLDEVQVYLAVIVEMNLL